MALLVGAIALPASARRDEGRWVPSLPVDPEAWTYTELFDIGVGYASTGRALLETSDSGQTWMPVAAPEVSGGLTYMSFADPRRGYGLAEAFGLVSTKDRGETWSEMTLPPMPKGTVPAGGIVDALEAPPRTDHVIATGWGWTEPNPERQRRINHLVWRSVDAGEHWDLLELPYAASAREIEFNDRNNGLIVLHRFRVEFESSNAEVWRTYQSVVLRTRDGGRSFEKIHSMNFSSGDRVITAALASPNRILLGTRQGRVLVSADGGRRFREVARLRPLDANLPARLDALTFATKKIGYAGSDGIGMWSTSDGGRTWTRETSVYEAGVVGDDTNETWRGSIAATGVSRAIATGPGFLSRRVVN